MILRRSHVRSRALSWRAYAALTGGAMALGCDVWIASYCLFGCPIANELVWLLTLLAGLCFLPTSWRSVRWGLGGVAITVTHIAVLAVGCASSSRTFYGGLMVPVVAGYVWVLLAAILLLSTAFGWLFRKPGSAEGP